MKKALSVLLTVTMLLGCFSVGFVSFAAPADEEAMAALLKDTTTYATNTTFITVKDDAWNENTYVSLPASYSFSKQVTNSVTLPVEADFIAAAGSQEAYEEQVLKAIIEDEDGKYESYIYRDTLDTAQVVNVSKLASDSLPLLDMVAEVGVQSVEPTACEPGKTGNNKIGDDALKTVELTADEIKNYSAASGIFYLDDIVLADQTTADFEAAKTEDSSLAKVISVIASDTADKLLEALRKNENVSDVTNYVFKLTNIKVTPTFTTETLTENTIYGDVEYAAGDTFTKIAKLDVNYNVEISGDVRFVFSDVAVPFAAKQNVTTSYYQIKEIKDSLLNPSTVEYLADVVKAETAAIEASGTDAHPAGYTFSKNVTVLEQIHSEGSSVLDDSTNAILKNIIDAKYPEFGGYINTNEESAFVGQYYNDDLSRFAYDDMIISSVGLADNGSDIFYDGTGYNVAKGVVASEILGIDALKTMIVDKSEVKSYNYNATSKSVEFTFKDQEVFPSSGEPCALAGLYDNMLADNLDEEFAANFKAATLGSTVEDIKVVYEQPTLTVAYSFGEVTAIKIAYNINYSANLYLADMVNASPVSGIYQVEINYTDVEKFDEENDIDPYDLAAAINSATEYIIANKPAYSFERNASFTDGPNADVSANIIGKVTGVVDMIAGLLGTSVTDKVNALVKDMLLGDMDVTDYSQNVPLTENGVDYLGAEYALKETCVEPNDMVNVAYNADRGVITFKLRDQINPEKDEMNALSRLSNDFTSTQDLRNKLALQLVGDLGISFISDDEPCDVTYTDINCYVGFTGSDAENVLGDGTLSAMGVSYDSVLAARFSDISIDANETYKSLYSDFEYFDYEMGDVDMSTRVSVVDAKIVLKAVAGLTTIEGRSFELADMNYDKKISVVDAKKILEKIANK